MSKEQIAEIKNKFHSFLNQSERSTVAISQNHLNLLIEQADRGAIHSKKIDELHVFLQNNVDILANEKWGHHVIGAAIHVIKKQAERANELDGFMNKADESLVKSGKQIMKLTDEKAELEYQNKRYREAIENALAEGEFEDVHDQLERVVSTLNEALEGDPHESI